MIMGAYAFCQHNCVVLELVLGVQIPFILTNRSSGDSRRRLRASMIALEQHINCLGLSLESSAGVLLTGQKEQCRGCYIPF